MASRTSHGVNIREFKVHVHLVIIPSLVVIGSSAVFISCVFLRDPLKCRSAELHVDLEEVPAAPGVELHWVSAGTEPGSDLWLKVIRFSIKLRSFNSI